MEFELFSEIYNCYFLVVRRILEEAAGYSLTENDLNRIADAYGYEESALAIVPKLVSGEWDLLYRSVGSSLSENRSAKPSFRSKVAAPEPFPLTALQRSWLKFISADPRFRLFFSDSECERLDRALQDDRPLFSAEDFCFFDQYSDGDAFHLETYRSHFQAILEGIRANRILTIDYFSAKNHLTAFHYLPCRLEYSAKDDKFRLLAVRVRADGSLGKLTILNLSRIMRIQDTGKTGAVRPDIDALLEQSLCTEPVVLEISRERGALERTMLHFACYQKRTEKLGETGKYLCRIYYSRDVETELLIQILSFGPVVKVLGPEGFLKQVRERVEKQRRLLTGPSANESTVQNG